MEKEVNAVDSGVIIVGSRVHDRNDEYRDLARQLHHQYLPDSIVLLKRAEEYDYIIRYHNGSLGQVQENDMPSRYWHIRS